MSDTDNTDKVPHHDSASPTTTSIDDNSNGGLSKRARVGTPESSEDGESSRPAAQRADPANRLEAISLSAVNQHQSTITTTTTTGEEEEEPSVTVYCDACKKARILKVSFAAKFDLEKEWTCIEACVKGCDQPDDELQNIAGDLFAAVLNAAGVKTRRELAVADPNEFDAGPWAPYLEEWIEQARSQEIHDAMLEIVGDDELLGRLEEAGIVAPHELMIADEGVLTGFIQSSALIDQLTSDVRDVVVQWRIKATTAYESHPWMTEV